MNDSSFWSALALGGVALAWLGFVAGIIVIETQLHRGAKRAPVVRRDSLTFAGLLLELCGVGVVFVFHREFGAPLFAMPETLHALLSIFTALLAIASAAFLLTALHTLGRQLYIGAKIAENHELVTRGPYAVVRHPIYTALLGLAVATALSLGRWEISLPALAVLSFGTLLRVKSEERLLRPAFGNKYEEYARRVPALIPKLFRAHAAAD